MSPAQADVLPWHQRAWQRFAHAFDEDRLAHALLIGGPAGTGRRRFADRLAGTLLCLAGDADTRPCSACAACQQFAAGTHADCFRLEPAEAGKAIGVDAVRDLIDNLHLTAGGERKVGIIDPADALTINAANSLLKTLEEPPAGTCLILLSAHSARLPATVRSRCQGIDLPAPDAALAIEWLQAQGVERAEDWLARAGGAPVLARTLAQANSEQEPGADPVEMLLTVLARRRSPVGAAARLEGLSLDAVVRAWILVIEDLLRLRRHPAARVRLPARRDELATLAPRLDERRLFDYLDELYRSIPGPSSALRAPMQIQGLLVDAAGMSREAATRGA